MTTYRVVQEMSFHPDTPDRVITLLCNARANRTRFKLYYGNLKTGELWGDVETCYVGRSSGQQKIPLAIKNFCFIGGEVIFIYCIVKIEYANKKNGVRPLWDVTDRGYSPTN